MYILPVQHCPLVPCACADKSSMNFEPVPSTCNYHCRGHTPHCKQLLWVQLGVQWRRSRAAQTSLLDYWQVCIWQRTDLASRFTRGLVASASTCSAGLSKRTALSRQSFDNVSLALAMAWGIKATLGAHGPTVLTNPEPCSADLLSAHTVCS